MRLSQDMIDRLNVLAGLNNDTAAEHASYLLEKMIVAEFHAVTLQAARLSRLGLTGIERDLSGSSGILREAKG
ncbi:MAG: hypothetical protein LBE22_10465 [Azoarcus sp.]|nr:hypothetical protein [Azoarcus sp.]